MILEPSSPLGVACVPYREPRIRACTGARPNIGGCTNFGLTFLPFFLPHPTSFQLSKHPKTL